MGAAHGGLAVAAVPRQGTSRRRPVLMLLQPLLSAAAAVPGGREATGYFWLACQNMLWESGALLHTMSRFSASRAKN